MAGDSLVDFDDPEAALQPVDLVILKFGSMAEQVIRGCGESATVLDGLLSVYVTLALKHHGVHETAGVLRRTLEQLPSYEAQLTAHRSGRA